MKQGQDPMGQRYALASDCDATQLDLTAAEGYLLSRFDGSTPWRVLREMAGIPVDEADSCLSRWVEEGILEAIPDATNASASGASTATAASTTTTNKKESKTESATKLDAAEVPTEERPPPRIDETQLDEGLDLDLSVQRRILEFEASLGLPYHELLAVPRGSEPKVVKRAYFKLSKEFHPDRYFRKEIGTHAARLDKIFKKVLEAHEMLSDPDLCQVENQSEQEPVADTPVAELPASEAVVESAPAKPKTMTKLERLRQRMPFKIDQAAIDARREKAQEIFRAAELSQKAGRLLEAEASIRIAISFDPSCAEFKEALGGLRIQAAGANATKLLATPISRMSDGELRDAWKLIEDVLIYRPHDPELNERAARVCLKLGKFELAEEYAETLIERAPDVAGSHTLMGQIRREQGDLDAAVSSFETALKLDEEDLDARRALASVRIGTRNQAQRGMA